MFKAVYEVVLRGLSEELECISKLYRTLSTKGICIGSQTMFICSYENSTIIKVTPHTSKYIHATQLYRDITQPLTITITIEGSSANDIIDAATTIYDIVKGCGLQIRLLSE